jgi:hypothetical protein
MGILDNLRTMGVSMPAPVTVGLALFAGASLVSLMYFLPGRYVYLIVFAMAGVALVVAVYALLLKGVRRRRAKPLEKGIVSNSAAAPQAVSEPARRARMDDLRKTFETGVSKFRSAGKSLYSLPWYAIVGEPGSGKTEAVRHCNVGFPPGLHDQFQGVGGTINMNWWFTNHAIILDTAGRLMFEEIQPGASSEWNEFLKLLRQNRPNCPINGMFLVIPSDSLIKDSADQIERKGAKIANQLDQIQRALGVRFPVFVIVTKCDLINGFREFFENIDDPGLQHQMLGWSNPAPLDEQFNPALIDQHMETVLNRLRRRRLALMIDPVHTEDPSGRRVDQVDSLFSFPQSLAKVFPRLRRYLEMIFVAGEWAAKPLFLRGIYFNSSMREGEALDQDLADVLGVPVESLPEGKVWERERAYFLRDLFMEKAFKEKGLVTSAANAKGQHRRRKITVLLTGFIAVLVLGFFSWYFLDALRKSIGPHRDFWVTASDYKTNWESDGANAYWRPVISPEFQGSSNYIYNAVPVVFGGKKARVAEIQQEARTLVQNPPEVPWVFRVAATISADIKGKSRQAEQVIFESSVLMPVVKAARDKMMEPNVVWTGAYTGALAQLIRLEAYGLNPAAARNRPKPEPADLDALMRFVLQKDEYFKAYQTQDAAALREVSAFLYSGDKALPWPPRALEAGSQTAALAVNEGVRKFIESWKNPKTSQSLTWQRVDAVKVALREYRDAEKELLESGKKFDNDPNKVETVQDASAVVSLWGTRFDALKGKRDKVATTLGDLGADSLTKAYEQATGELYAQAEKACEPIRTEIRLGDGAEKKDNILTETDRRLTDALKSLREDLAKRDANELRSLELEFLALADNVKLYEIRYQVYSRIGTQFAASQPAAKVAELTGRISQIRDATQTAQTGIRDLVDKGKTETGFRPYFKEADAVSRFALQIGRRLQVYQLVQGVLKTAPGKVGDVEEQVKANATATVRPAIPLMIVGDPNAPAAFDSRYDPNGAFAVLESRKTIRGVFDDKNEVLLDARRLKDTYDQSQKFFDQYAQQYAGYWSDAADPNNVKGKVLPWKEFLGELNKLDAAMVQDALKDWCDKLDGGFGKTLYVEDAKAKEAVAASLTPRQDVPKNTRKALDSTGFRDECRDAMRVWKALGSDGAVARLEILKMKPSEFSDRFYLRPGQNDLARKYWSALTMAALASLADDSRQEGQKALAELRKYSKFPAAPALLANIELDANEVVAAREVLTKFKTFFEMATTQAVGGKTIAQGGTCEIPEVDKQLVRLREYELDAAQKDWVLRFRAVIDALPGKEELFACTVQVLGDEQQPDPKFSTLWNWLVLKQGQTQKGKDLVLQKNLTKLGELKYPGEPMTFEIYRHFSDKQFARSLTIQSGWPGIRLLFKGEATETLANGAKIVHRWDVNKDSRSEDGKEWTVQLDIYESKDAQGKDVYKTLLLRLRFEKGLPKLGEWPQP